MRQNHKKSGGKGGGPNIHLTDKCNQRCVFCLACNYKRMLTPAEIESRLRAGHRRISFEGGEPTLAPGLLKWVKKARALGTEEIVLFTNGLTLSGEEGPRALAGAGVTRFIVNFPTHDPGLNDLITGTTGTLPGRLRALRNMCSLGGVKTQLMVVVTSLNAPLLEEFAKFLAKYFRKLSYVEFSLVKVIGAAKKRPGLVPQLSSAGPQVVRALRVLGRAGIPCLTYGFPLCAIKGCADLSVDAAQMRRGELQPESYLRVPACASCAQRGACPGPREDYVKVRGSGGITALRGPLAG